jgi:hypothetical protein
VKQLTAIDRVYTHPDLLGNAFKDRATWAAWFAFLRAMFGLPLSPDQLAVYQECTGRSEAPDGHAREGWLACGRRAGKSRILALIAVYLACFCCWADRLSLGERGTLLIVATDRRQARVIFDYIRGFLGAVPSLDAMITRETAEVIELSNGIAIEVATASFRTIRGRTLIAALFDEAAFWRSDDSANPDIEILQAVRPSLATTGGLLLVASSPYAKRGILWRAFSRHHAKPGPILVWKAPTLRMNPTVPQSVIDEAYEADPAAAAAEYGAEFRNDPEAFVSREAIEAVTLKGAREIPPQPGLRYVAFIDAAGGSGQDSMTCAVAHYDLKDRICVLDAIREVRPPFSPESVVFDFAKLLKSYPGIGRAQSDKWGGQFVAEAFQRNGIRLEPAERTKSEFYVELLPMINSGLCRLLDTDRDRLLTQFASLERRVGRGTGRDSIDHPPGGHDDLANAAAGALVCAKQRPPWVITPYMLELAKKKRRPMPGIPPYLAARMKW